MKRYVWAVLLLLTGGWMQAKEKTELATVGGGCFWCLEAAFEGLPGILDVVSGYAGGKTDNPTYEQVCSGVTGHAEVVQIKFDPDKISYAKILSIFWKIHDPTSLNAQGADVGTQYRSIILHCSEVQKKEAEQAIREVGKTFSKPVVTELVLLKKFYPAEEYHQDYFRRHPDQAYCQAVIRPKLEKLKLDSSLRKD